MKEFKVSNKYSINCLVFSKNCIWASSEGSIKVLHETGEAVKEFNVGGTNMCIVKEYVWVCSNNEILICCSNNLTIEYTVEIQNDYPHLIKLIEDQVWVATTLNNILVYDCSSREKLFQIDNAHEYRINDIITAGDYIWSASDDETIAIWTKQVKRNFYFIFYFFIFLFFILKLIGKAQKTYYSKM